jgi:DNA polymerase-1
LRPPSPRYAPRPLPLIAEANLRGMVVDTLHTRELDQHLQDVAARQLKILAPHGVTEKIVRSPDQLQALMYDEWGLPVLKESTGKKTGKVSRSTDKEVLHELSFVDSRAKDLRTYREALGNRTKFATTLLTSSAYNEDGRTHPLAIPFGTYSGRLTYASKQGKNKDQRPIGFALHQEKRGGLYRAVIVPPQGYTLMEFDASGQEFRWMAIASGDEVMLHLCLPGEDAHSYMGARISGLTYEGVMFGVKGGSPVEKNARQGGKVANLSLQYRTSARKLRSVARVDYDIPMTLPEAQRIHVTYQRTYQRVPRYWDKQIAMTQRLGYVETFAGRRVQVKGNWHGKDGWGMGSTSINYRIQGTGADQKYLALSVLKPYLARVGAQFAWDLHDGIYFYVPDEHVERAAVEVKHLLDNLPYQRAWGFTPPIPMPWDCKVGKSWGTLKEWQG